MNTFKKLRFLLLAAPLVLLFACSKEETPTSVPTQIQSKLFFCNVSTYSSIFTTDFNYTASLYSDPTADSAQTRLYVYGMPISPDRIEIGEIHFSGGFWSSVNYDTVGIKLTSNQGNCSGSVLLPEPVQMVIPKQNDTLPFATSLQCIWHKSANTEWYYYYAYVDVRDSNGQHLLLKVTEGSTYDTTWTIPSSFLETNNASFYLINLAIHSMSGPMPSAGAKGNMTGDINGYLVCENHDNSFYFYLGTPVGVKTKATKLDTQPKLREWYIKQLKK